MDLIGGRTPTDQTLANLLVQGCSNQEVAGQLSISPRIVTQHLRTLFLRAGIRDGRKRVKLGSRGVRDQEAIQRSLAWSGKGLRTMKLAKSSPRQSK